MRIPELVKVLLKMYSPNNGETAMLLGPPGTAKTSICIQVAEQLEFTPIVRHPVYEEIIDARGIPFNFTRPDGSQSMIWLPPNDLPLEIFSEFANRPVMFILDDLTQAPPQVQNGYARLLHSAERVIAGNKIGKNVHVIATGNRIEDMAAATEMPSFARARTTFLTLDPHPEDWVAWAMNREDIAPEFISFLHPGDPSAGIKGGSGCKHIFDFDPQRRSSCSPRTLHIASKHFKALQGEPDSTVDEVLSGILCPAFAPEFRAHLRLYKDLPDIDSILAGKEYSKAFFAKGDVLYLVIISLLKKVDIKDKTHIQSIADFLLALPPEKLDYAVLLYKMARKRIPLLALNRSVLQWGQTNFRNGLDLV